MGFFRRLVKKKKISMVNLMMIFCLTALISIGCSSGGGGGDDGDDNNGGGGTTNPLVGVWELKSITEDCGDGDVDTTNFPNSYLVITVNAYVKITASTSQYYVKMSGISDEMASTTGWSNGTFSCSESADAYTVDGNTITEQDGATITYEISGDTLTLVSQSGEDKDCTLTLVLDKGSDSDISNAEDDCVLFESFGLLDL